MAALIRSRMAYITHSTHIPQQFSLLLAVACIAVLYHSSARHAMAKQAEEGRLNRLLALLAGAAAGTFRGAC